MKSIDEIIKEMIVTPASSDADVPNGCSDTDTIIQYVRNAMIYERNLCTTEAERIVASGRKVHSKFAAGWNAAGTDIAERIMEQE